MPCFYTLCDDYKSNPKVLSAQWTLLQWKSLKCLVFMWYYWNIIEQNSFQVIIKAVSCCQATHYSENTTKLLGRKAAKYKYGVYFKKDCNPQCAYFVFGIWSLFHYYSWGKGIKQGSVIPYLSSLDFFSLHSHSFLLWNFFSFSIYNVLYKGCFIK